MSQIIRFPNDFLWGSATSAHQVEGENTASDWWAWETAGRVRERSGRACGHWSLFEKDFELARALRHNAHRFSVEWSRIEPEKGCFSREALGHYGQVLTSLQKNGLEPILTLNHFTLPQWFSLEGGWLAAEAPRFFGRFVKTVAESLGHAVRYWVTINEPMVYLSKSYIEGEWPPGERSLKKASEVLRKMLRAHVLAYRIIHGEAQERKQKGVQVGIAHYSAALKPCRPNSFRDRLAVFLRNRLTNFMVLDALTNGCAGVPGFFSVSLAQRRSLDFIGINYYAREFVCHDGLGIPGIAGKICSLEHHRESGARNDLGWEIYPAGLYEMIRDFSRYGLPILITENGVSTGDDRIREKFIVEHIRSVGRARCHGFPVFGYLYWSLLDNFEWAYGFGPRFGLVEVDYRTLARSVRPSGRRYAELILKNEIEV